MAQTLGPYLSVVIPAYNEADRIGASLESVFRYLANQPWKSEAILVSDGGNDDTLDKSTRVAARFSTPLRVLENARTRGKTFTVKRDMLAAHGQCVLFSDADLSTPIESVERLIDALDEQHHVAIASRWLPTSDVRVPQRVARRLGSRLFNLMVRAVAVPGVQDSQCGFKCFRRDVARQVFALQRLDGFSFDVEVLLSARRLGYRIAEIPVTWLDHPHSTVRPIADPLAYVRRCRPHSPERAPRRVRRRLVDEIGGLQIGCESAETGLNARQPPHPRLLVHARRRASPASSSSPRDTRTRTCRPG